MKRLLIMTTKSAVIIALTTLLALALDAVGLRVENILMLYTIAILIVITETRKFLFGAVSAFVCVMVFNYFFTEPRFTFRVNDANYFVSFGIFFVVAFIVSTLTTRLNNQIMLSRQNEERTGTLYKISSGYLNITGSANIISYSEKSLSGLIGKSCLLYVKTEHNELADPGVLWCYSRQRRRDRGGHAG